MPINSFPPEILIRVLSFLPLQDIRCFELLSKSFHEVVATNESAVYQTAAVVHGFADSLRPGQTRAELLADLVNRPDALGWLDGVISWKELCKRHLLREYAWTGQSPRGDSVTDKLSQKSILPGPLQTVHRFKVDEAERTVIVSTSTGSIKVICIDTQDELWWLPKSNQRYVSPYAHVEFDRGFLVFTRRDHGMEVWRRSSDSYKRSTYLPCNPSAGQVAASLYPVPRFPPTFPPIHDDTSIHPAQHHLSALPRRGVYLPFALLYPPSPTRASRFVYPNLVVASEVATKAYIWDVPTSTLVETVDIPVQPPNMPPSLITYVELNEEFVFVCRTFVLNIYRRRQEGTTTAQLGASLSNVYFSLSLNDMIVDDPLRSYIDGRFCPIFAASVGGDTKIAVTEAVQAHTALGSHTPHYTMPDDFAAAHVSPDGHDLVTVTSSGWLLYLPDFDVATPRDPPRSPFKIYFSHAAVHVGSIEYLAFDGKRILLAFECSILSITLKDSINPCSPSSVLRVRHLASTPHIMAALDPRVSCIQLHSGTAWFAARLSFEASGGILSYVDLTASTRSGDHRQ